MLNVKNFGILQIRMKEALVFNYRFILLVTGIFGVFLFLLFGTTHALPQSPSESSPTAEFLSGTTNSPTNSTPLDTSIRTIRNESHFFNETTKLELNTSTTLIPVNISGQVSERVGKKNSSNLEKNDVPIPFASGAVSSPSPSPSPSLSTSSESLKTTILPSTPIPPSTSTILAKASLTGDQSLKQFVGNGDTLPKNPQDPKENGRSLSFPQNHSSNRLQIKENAEKGKIDSSKLLNLTLKSTPTPISVQDKRIRMVWGGDCTHAVWNVCNRIKSWGGDYLVPDKNNPEKMVKRYYKINCVEKPEQTFCLRNGWTVARCHMLCMSQCNVDFKLNFDKVVSHEGECKWPILGRK